MDTELLDILPRELRFTFELKRQSSCSVQLINKSNQYVAFKIKTTSPKKYCVRPNTGILHPKSTCDFTVTMQAQRVAPPDMQCKDKFLVQGTVVSRGTEAEDITPDMFAKDSENYIDEHKLRVFLDSPPQSPVLLPINGGLKEEDYEALASRDPALSGVENLPPLHKVANIDELLKPSKKSEELRPAKDMVDFKQTKDAEFKLDRDMDDLKPTKAVEAFKQTNDMEELKVSKGIEEWSSPKKLEDLVLTKNDEELRLVEDVEELKGKLKGLEAKLIAAEDTINMLRQERSTTSVEKQTMQQQLAALKRTNGVRKEQVGFPFLFVCMVALICLVSGYRLHG